MEWNDFNSLTPQEQDEFSKILVVQKLRSKEQLKYWLKYFLDVDLIDTKVSRFATSTPLDFVWDIYEFCLNDKNEEPLSLFGIAGRGSQKTLGAAVLQVILPLHFKRGVVHLGGTDAQANRAYNYFRKFALRQYIKPYLVGEPKISRSEFNVGGKIVENEILSITLASVNGPHQPVVSIDELASLAPNKLAAYPSIAGIPVYTEDGRPWVKFGISSRYGRYTVIETEYENREETGAIFKFWTILENTKRCPDSISGTEDFSYYVDIFDNKAVTIQEYEKLDLVDKDKFEKVNAKKGCFSCPMKVVCAGDAKKQNSKCRTLKPIRATISEFKQSQYDWFLSQKMSLQPSSEDLVYPKFKRKEFEKTPRQMYEVCFGKDPQAEITEEDLIREFKKAGLKRYAGVDHGYTHPFALVIIYEDSLGNVYIMKSFEQSGLEPPEVVDVIQKFKLKYDFTVVYPDTANPAVNNMIKKVVKVIDDFNKSPHDGIALIRQKMCPSVGPTKFYGLSGNVDSLINNLEKYHFSYASDGKLTDKPVKEFDDSHDGLSYAAQNRWNKGKLITSPNDPNFNKKEKEETKEQYAEKVNKQYDDWLSQQIKQTTAERGGTSGTKSSKSKNFFWDVD